MEPTQIIYPIPRLLANPKIFMAIANELQGPDWETLAAAFYELIESDVLEAENSDEAVFNSSEVCFRLKPDQPDVIQVILTDGCAIELHPQEADEYLAVIRNEEEFAITSTIYGRIVRAIEAEVPELAGDIALCEPPTPGNEYLRDEMKDCFSGQFHLLSNPEKLYNFEVTIVDVTNDILKAFVKPVP